MYVPYYIYSTEVSIRYASEYRRCPESEISIPQSIGIQWWLSSSRYSDDIPPINSALYQFVATSKGRYRRASCGIGVSWRSLPDSRPWVLANGRPRRRCHFRQACRSLTGEPCKCPSRRGETRAEGIGEARREVRARRHAPEGRERRRGAAESSTVSSRWPQGSTPGSRGRRIHPTEGNPLDFSRIAQQRTPGVIVSGLGRIREIRHHLK